MEQQLQEQTKTHISQALGITLVGFAGLASAAAFLFFGWQKPQTTTTTLPAVTTTTETKTVDLTSAPIPSSATQFSSDAYTQKLSSVTASAAAAEASGVTLTFTNPTEGAIVNGTETIAVHAVDPNNKVYAVRFYTTNDLYGYFVGTTGGQHIPGSLDWSTEPTLGLYPSGEYRYVATAIDAQANVLASTDVMVTVSHSCYYLAYQDMTLASPTASIHAGSTFTVTGTVTNKQRGSCQHIYTLDTNDPVSLHSLLPTGWTATFDQASLTLGIGETKTFAMTVTVPATATVGTYSVGATSRLQHTGFAVVKKIDAKVVAVSGGGDTGTQEEAP